MQHWSWMTAYGFFLMHALSLVVCKHYLLQCFRQAYKIKLIKQEIEPAKNVDEKVGDNDFM